MKPPVACATRAAAGTGRCALLLALPALALACSRPEAEEGARPREQPARVAAALSSPGLLAGFGFEEGAGTVVQDESGLGHDSTLTQQTFAPGKFGMGLAFDDSVLTIADSEDFDFTEGVTVSAWVLPSAAPPSWRWLVTKELGWDGSFGVIFSEVAVRSPIAFVVGASNGTAEAPMEGVISPAEWSHVAMTYDGEQLRLLVNGEILATGELVDTLVPSEGPLSIGGHSLGGDFFKGRIDELRIYTRGLSQAEVQADMAAPVTEGALLDTTAPTVSLDAPANGSTVSGLVTLQASASDDRTIGAVQFLVDGVPVGGPDTTFPYEQRWLASAAAPGTHTLQARALDAAGNSTLGAPVEVAVSASGSPRGLILAFGFDEGSGVQVQDSTAAAHQATLSGQTWVRGKFGAGLDFETAPLIVPGSDLLDLQVGMTVSAWVLPRPSQPAYYPVLVKDGDSAVPYLLYAEWEYGGPFAALNGFGPWVEAGVAQQLSRIAWSHLAATYDGDRLSLFIDGELASGTDFEGPLSTASGSLYIGGYSLWDQRFVGRIDELRVYDRALTASEIQADMTTPVNAAALPDTTPPSVAVTAPSGTVSGLVMLEATASDDDAVGSVRFLVDGVAVGGAVLAPPYRRQWLAGAVQNGQYAVRAEATDLAGNTALSAPVTVTVEGGAAVPGLVAAYGFDEGTGTVAHDATALGNDAELDGQTWVGGKYGGALEFDGNLIALPRSEFLELSSGMTLSAWVLPRSAEPVEGVLFSKRTMWERSYELTANMFWERAPAAFVVTDEGLAEIFGTATLPTATWSHVAATYDGAELKLYVDGGLASQADFSGPIRPQDGPLTLGGRQPWGDFFLGRIDEVRIYDRALTLAELQQEMATPVTAGALPDTTPPVVSVTAPTGGVVSGLVSVQAAASDDRGVASVTLLVDGTPIGAPLTRPPFAKQWLVSSVAPGEHALQARAVDFAGNTTLSAAVTVTVEAGNHAPGLVAAYGFDEGTGEIAHDGTAAANDALLDGQSWVGGKYGSALEFDGNLITLPETELLELSSGMTLAAWVLPRSTEPRLAFLFSKRTTWDASYEFAANTFWERAPAAFLTTENGVGSVFGSATLPTSSWSHVAATSDGSRLELYVNGVFASRAEISGSIRPQSGPLALGGRPIWGDFYIGRMDEVRIYNRALTRAEIQQDMTRPVTPGASLDTTPPVVSVTAPAPGVVGGLVTLDAGASDDRGVASVTFFVDGTAHGAPVWSAPFERTWLASAALPGEHTLQARATDFAGNSNLSAPVTVTVEAGSGPAGLVAAYGFDEGDGTIARDATAAENHAPLAGQIWVGGKYGSALEFEGNLLTLPASELFDLSSGMTLAAWVLPAAGDPSDWTLVLGKPGREGSSYDLLANTQWYSAPAAFVNTVGGFRELYGVSRLPSMRWSHLAATYDGAKLKLYVDGALANQTPASGAIRSQDAPPVIGGNPYWGGFFQGRIDEVRIYNRALTLLEIQDVLAAPITAGAGPDTTPPAVSLTAPAPGLVSGLVALSAEVSDDGGVASVTFLLDGKPVGAPVTAAPFEKGWLASSASPGDHVLQARATDLSGNSSLSAPVLVSIQAGSGSPGLVAAYGFDEGSGGAARDGTPAQNHATLSGQTWLRGKYGSALRFENNRLTLPRSELLELSSGMTLAAWVLPTANAPTDWSVVLGKHGSLRSSYELLARAGGGLPSAFLNAANGFGEAYGTAELPTTRWSHLAGTYDGSVLKLYVDGALASQMNVGGSIVPEDAPVVLGGNPLSDGTFFNGRLDEVRIYDRALSAAEILEAMATPVTAGAAPDTTPPVVNVIAPASGVVPSLLTLQAEASDESGVASVEFLLDGAPLGPRITGAPFEQQWLASTATPGEHTLRAQALDFAGNTALSAPVTVTIDPEASRPGLVAGYGFDEGTGNAVYDVTAAENDGVLAGQTRVEGKFGGALHFNGTLIEFADSDFLDLTRGMTLSAWLMPTRDTSPWTTVMMKDGGWQMAYLLYAGNEDVGPSVFIASERREYSAQGSSALPLQVWTHLTGTYDGARLRLFVNGELAVEREVDRTIERTSGPFTVGGNYVWDDEFFFGRIDEVRVYNRALTAAEIQSDMLVPVGSAGAADTTPPTVAVTAPAAGSTVTGSVTLEATASDDRAVASVEFFVDGVAIGAPLSAPPYRRIWATSGVTAGPHTVTARARDFAGNSTLSAGVSVTVGAPPVCNPATVTDGNPCTVDTCAPDGTPVFTPLAAGTSCSDGNRCNGLEQCNGSGTCRAGTAPSSDATCDGVDDDCDGQLDENFVGTPTACGVGACARNAVTVCQGGNVVNPCTPGTPAANDVSCNAVDDDCSGQADEDYVSVATSCGVGGCARSGATSCVAGNVVNSCAPGTPAANDSVCNGIDDDCSGQTDEDVPIVPVSCGVGACERSGVRSCSGGTLVTVCDPGVPAARDATCDDNDDDCDGQDDEDYASIATFCGTGSCRGTGVTRCVDGAVLDSCEEGMPGASDASCDGVDGDCDGSADEDYVARSSSCGVGACAATGTTSCVSGAERSNCTPRPPAAPEDTTCNGLDDDCDGSADEEFAGSTTACGVGACARTGVSSCVNGSVVNGCTPGTPAPADATCNGVDDDCDGQIDEDYAPVSVQCGVGACRVTTTSRCEGGAVITQCQPRAPAASDASCDGIDDDCNGQADEDYLGAPVTCGAGVCARTAVSTCVGGAVVTNCTPGTPAANDASCNGADDDCNGQVDEDYVPTPSSCGVGACVRSGTNVCSGGTIVNDCTPGAAAPSDASCNGADDDCNGQTDEDFVQLTTQCGVGACRRDGVIRCESGAVVPACTPGAAAPSDASCNGIDDDCNGQADEDYVQQSTTCGAGACASTGTTACSSGQVVDSCTPGTGGTSDSVCNGIDDDCDGQADEDFAPVSISCGAGACARTGTRTCQGGNPTNDCTPGAPASNDATCDGIDDDCDGQADEDFAGAPITCGAGACRANGRTRCLGGAISEECEPRAPAANDASCNGIDDDCNGTADEDYAPQPISCGVGACSRNGTTACTAGSVVPSCTPGAPAADDVSCDGIDQDCNGTADEDYVPEPTTCGAGSCQASGQTRCEGGDVVDGCTPGIPGPSDTTCNGVDEDCDGIADDGFVPAPTQCGVGACRAAGTTTCSGGQVGNSCTPGTPASSDSLCNGADDDCDGRADEDYVSQSTLCGVGGCQSSGTTACVGGAVRDSCRPGTPQPSDSDCDGVDDDCDGSADEAFVVSCSGDSVSSCTGGALQTSACTDGNACNGAERCAGGACTTGSPPALDDGNPCTDDRCEALLGVLHEPSTLGTPCGPTHSCDGQGSCVALPAITAQPQSITVNPGQPFAFSVTASGGGLTYQWRRAGADVPGATLATYFVPSAVLSDNGAEFTVRVQNTAGAVTSQPAIVTVLDGGGPVLRVDGAAARTVESDLLTLKGSATDTESGVASVVVRSDRFPGPLAALLSPATGLFSAEIPLFVGDNALTVIATDLQGNATQQSVLVKLVLSSLPRVSITQPVMGSSTQEELVDVRGTVRSSLAPESIRLLLGNEVRFPTGAGGEYTFEFEDVRLAMGQNVLVVRAETAGGAASAQVVVDRVGDAGATGTAPVVRVVGVRDAQFVQGSSFLVKGTVTAGTCVSSVSVNGLPATVVGEGSEVSFELSLALPAGDAPVPVAIAARDCDGRVGRSEFTLLHDDLDPVITAALAPAPATHSVTATPYTVTGRITEKHLAGVSANNQSISVLPGPDGSWDFSVAVPLVRGLNEPLDIEAWDHAGNRGSYRVLLAFEGNFGIEVIAPSRGAEFLAVESTFSLNVVARAQGLGPGHVVTARAGAGTPAVLGGAGSTYTGALVVPGATAEHELVVEVRASGGQVLERALVPFRTQAASEIPLSAIVRDPPSGARNVEANQVIQIELSRPVNPAETQLVVRETVHGKGYPQYPSGAGVAEFSSMELVEVRRDDDVVPGSLSYLPGDRVVAFYPARDFGYGAEVTVLLRVGGADVLRSSFGVRPLPTLITGFVADQFYNAIEGVEVLLDGGAASAVTNHEGAFSFGFGTYAASIAGGRHLVTVNPGLKDRRYGTIVQWAFTHEGRPKDLGVIRAPLLGANEPFRRIASRSQSTPLLGGRLVLDLSQADLTFPDGAAAGDVHTQVLMGPSVGYRAQPVSIPFLTYVVQPMGVEVEGTIALDFDLPEEGGATYVDSLPELVLLSGLDPRALEIVPAGVGRVDKNSRRVRSEGRLALERLDFISITPLRSAAAQKALGDYVAGASDLSRLVAALQELR